MLDADLAGHAAAEGSLYDDGRVCALWDEVDNMEVAGYTVAKTTAKTVKKKVKKQEPTDGNSQG